MNKYVPIAAVDSARRDRPEDAGSAGSDADNRGPLPADLAEQIFRSGTAFVLQPGAASSIGPALAPVAEPDEQEPAEEDLHAEVESTEVEPATASEEAQFHAEPDADDDPSWDGFDAAKLATIARSGYDPVPMIRDIVSRNASEAGSDETAAPEPRDGKVGLNAVRSHRARRARRADRWASLRDALSETEPVAGEDPVAAPDAGCSEEAPATPLERIRAREAAGTPSHQNDMPEVQVAEDFVPYDDSVFGGSGTDDTGAPPPSDDLLPDPPRGPRMGSVEARVWDMPADNEMSKGGRLAWRFAVYGSILAIPAVLLLTSPFAPKDTVAHYVAAAGCTAAGYAGLAPAKVGMPGYHAHLDDNGNGVACEPTVQRKLKGNGKVTFIRVGDHQ